MIRIGKIVASHGLQGALVMTHIIGRGDWLKKDDVLFLEPNKGSFIPYFVTSVKTANSEEYIIQVEDVTTVEAARKLVSRPVYVKEDVLGTYASDSPLLWIGFNMIDRQKGALGPIEDVLQTGSQWLAKLTYEGKEVLVPLISQMILDVNIRNKYVRVDLPEGLLEVYL